jgi:NAD(P)-dependent dehydrogenase (short-subunit alcohol dehydrogenase family)
MKAFKDKVAVVTGAASGIGRGMAENFVELGMTVVLADIDEERLERQAEVLKGFGAKVLGVATDVSRAEQVEALARKTLDTFGEVHVLCNNAGVSYGEQHSWEIPLEGWNWVLGINLMSVIYGIHFFLPTMLEQNTECHVVNTASLAGFIVNNFNISEGISKHAVVALSESLHTELEAIHSKVKVSVLCPGPVNTDILSSSERNRPFAVPPPPYLEGRGSLFRESYANWLQHGLDPQEVGHRVVDAIREERFYVITHDLNRAIEQRLKNIMTCCVPQVPRRHWKNWRFTRRSQACPRVTFG